ncbi:MAG: class I mannose-6-phosphate isomerase [Eudoraea sp.]|nr:class I mannose-6-phosphate isomerase [Eudoraea sp.]
MILYPLKFQPILKERLWGGTKLGTILGKSIPNNITGESWELSGVQGDVSVVANEELAGTSLNQLIETYTDDLLGKGVVRRFGKDFPILIKFIDAKQDLSIQLHPNDELAKKRHNSFGKTEMWYVMDADEDANLIVGFNQDVTKDVYAQSLENDTLLELMNYEKVTKGDTFFINTGKIHAIGAGVLLAEIQQTSDVTYRVFDFNRKDKDGNYRELHTDLALDAIDYKKQDDFRVQYSKEIDQANKMVDCPYFRTDYLNLQEDFTQDISNRDSFTIYMCVDGKAVISNESGTVTIVKGETTLLPANTNTVKIETQGTTLLEITI